MFEGERLTRNNVTVNKHFRYKLMGRSSTLHYKYIALSFNAVSGFFITAFKKYNTMWRVVEGGGGLYSMAKKTQRKRWNDEIEGCKVVKIVEKLVEWAEQNHIFKEK